MVNHTANWTHYSSYHMYLHLAIYFGSFRSLSDVSYSDERRTKIGFSVCLKHGTPFSCCSETLKSIQNLYYDGFLSLFVV